MGLTLVAALAVLFAAYVPMEVSTRLSFAMICMRRAALNTSASFNTGSKQPRKGNASRNKFMSIRLPFESFKPVRRRTVDGR